MSLKTNLLVDDTLEKMNAKEDTKEDSDGHRGRILWVVVVVGIASVRVTDVAVGAWRGSITLAVAGAGIVAVSPQDLGGREDDVRKRRHCASFSKSIEEKAVVD